MTDWILPIIEQYANEHSSNEPIVLKQLNRDTHANILQPRMLSGHYQGRLLSMISHMVAPTYVLEIGTYTGYSAICLAEGLVAGGRLITIDVNAEREEMVNHYIKQAGFAGSIQHIIGDALRIIPTLPYEYDLVFVDADKPNYPAYYELGLNKLRTGGFMLIDNVLWSGKVANETDRTRDKDAALLHQLNQQIQSDSRVENLLLPIRDGLLLIRKR